MNLSDFFATDDVVMMKLITLRWKLGLSLFIMSEVDLRIWFNSKLYQHANMKVHQFFLTLGRTREYFQREILASLLSLALKKKKN